MDGDGWVVCDQGHRHWGVHGAAGLALTHRDPAGVRWLLLQHRASWSHHGGTWGLLGGARTRAESAEQAAAREAVEEAGLEPAGYRLVGAYVDDHGGWSYTSVLAEAAELLVPGGLTPESADVRWVRLDALDGLPLHPGFAASWPAVARLL